MQSKKADTSSASTPSSLFTLHQCECSNEKCCNNVRFATTKGGFMAIENKLGIKNSAQFALEEERLSKLRALELFDKNMIGTFEIGTFEGLSKIHQYLFAGLYDFAGTIRTVNIARGSFRFVPVLYLPDALNNIDKMPHSSFDEIVEKYVEMNIAHPFREGNGRSMRLWLDCMFKDSVGKVINWKRIDKVEYLMAMERSPVKDLELKHLLKSAFTDRIYDREVYVKGIEQSYYYENLDSIKMDDLDCNK